MIELQVLWLSHGSFGGWGGGGLRVFALGGEGVNTH